MKVYFTEFHYKKKYNTIDYIVFAVLFLPSIIYLIITECRNFLYKTNLISTYKPKILTISIGNLTTGGTGKTPITAAIANYFFQKGKKAAILSRGYGGKLDNKKVNIISDGNNIYFTAQESGDEPFWLSQNCPKSVILTCSSRVKSIKLAQEKLNVDVAILDDGYQHQKLKRDINILVTDSEKKFSNGFVLPLGALREPLCEINRADRIVVVNKNFDSSNAEEYVQYLKKKYKKPVYLCNMKPSNIYNIKTGEKLSKNVNIFAFCAIGQPEQFYQFLEKKNIIGTKNFPDHHIYTNEDIKNLSKLAKIFVTTEKDAVKLKDLDLYDTEIYALKLKPELDIEGLLNG